MKLSDMELVAHKGLDKVEPWANQGIVSPRDVPEHGFIIAASRATAQLPPGQSYEKKLMEALYKDARWLVRMYAACVNEVVDDVSSVDHHNVLHRSSKALLTIADMSDASKHLFTEDSDAALSEGDMPLDVCYGMGEVQTVDWSEGSKYAYDLSASSPRQCPALRARSTINPESTMIEHFFGRYVDVLADRTIAHQIQQPIGEISLMSYGH